MLKNNQRQAAMYIGLGILIAIVLLLAMGRLRTERYEGEVSEAELENMLSELSEDEQPMEGEMEMEMEDEMGMEDEMTATGPSAGYESD
jgi:chromosome condensin MukBEF complex kleisin-like MukF subunit